jgi:hypothetical protein
MKFSTISDLIMTEIMGKGLDSQAYILANDMAGGVVLGWKTSVFTEQARVILNITAKCAYCMLLTR